MDSGGKRRGAALPIVLAVLTLLALIAVTFSLLQQIDRKVAQNYLNNVRAKQLARSGIEVAYGRLLEGVASGEIGTKSQFIKTMTYFGKDTMETGDPLLTAVPLEVATSPSFALETNTPGNPFGPLEEPQDPTDTKNYTARGIWVQTGSGVIPVGVSGIMDTSAHGRNSDFFSVQVRDCSGMIYVNDGLYEHPSYGSVTKNLRRILNKLGDQINVPGLGEKLILKRPPTGYQSKRELITVLGSIDFEKVAPFITVHAWVDRNVPNPVPLSDDGGVRSYYNSWYPGLTVAGPPGPNTIFFRGTPPKFRYGRGVNWKNEPLAQPLRLAGAGVGLTASNDSRMNGIYGIDELFPQWIEVTARAPVNINAAPKEVLVALLADVHGFWVCERRRNSPPAKQQSPNWASWSNIFYTYDETGGDKQPADEGDEFGFLVTSDPIKGPGSKGTNSADAIADEIIRCRNRQPSQSGGFDYAAAPFGGPFRSWRQFYLFCDNLVNLGIIQETRGGLHPWYAPGSTNWGATPGSLTSIGYASDLYKRMASQAIADAIKANFNPNLHLNEANPDENMNLLIDKTDLIVMSTEGTFFPTGYFEIESLGRVVRPPGGLSGDALDASMAAPCELISEAKVQAVIKVYDAIRFTSQRDFYGSSDKGAKNHWEAMEAARAINMPPTSNGLSIEIGPEPDWGVAAEQCEWGGYIAWPTYGSDDEEGMRLPGLPIASSDGANPPSSCSDHPRGNDDGGAQCIMHAHFTRSDYLHHGVRNVRENLARSTKNAGNVGVTNINHPDPNEPEAGPYHPFEGPDWPLSSNSKGNKYRLARSFRTPQAGQATISLPINSLPKTAPLDLRIDGVYLERGSTLAYWIEPGVVPPDHRELDIAFSYWIKPKYYPEMTERIRLYWNWSRLDVRNDLFQWPTDSPFNPLADDIFRSAHYFCASQDPVHENSPYKGGYWLGWLRYKSPIRPTSMLFLNWSSTMTVPEDWIPSRCLADTRNCAGSPTLNHHLHDTGNYPACGKPTARLKRTMQIEEQEEYLFRNPLAAGRWMHFIYGFQGKMSKNDDPRVMYINGVASNTKLPKQPYDTAFADITSSSLSWQSSNYYEEGGAMPLDWTKHELSNSNKANPQQVFKPNPVRLGETIKWNPLDAPSTPTGNHSHNFVPDATIDEFYMVKGSGKKTSSGGVASASSLYTMYRMRGRYHIPRFSEGVYVSPKFDLPITAASQRSLPPPTNTLPPGGKTVASSGSVTLKLPQPKIIGAAWTWAAEWVDLSSPDLDPVLTDYSTLALMPKKPLQLKPRLHCGIKIDGKWTPDLKSEFFSPVLVPVVNPRDLQFRFQFVWETSAPSSGIVHATPYIDDITIYFDDGTGGYIEYHMIL